MRRPGAGRGASAAARRLAPAALAALLAVAGSPGSRGAASPAEAPAAEAMRIGLVAGPGTEGDALAAGAGAAVAEVNASGGVAGRPVELVRVRPSEPWRDGASRLARLIYEERIGALVGPADAAGAHVAAQVATRRRIPVLTLSPETGLTRAHDPWVFRGVPDDAAQARALLRWALPEPSGARAAAVVPEGRPGRERLAALQEACDELDVELAHVIRPAANAPGTVPPAPGGLDVLLLWLDPAPAVALLRGLSAGPLPPHVLGSSRLDSRTFLDGALGRQLPRVAVPLLRAGPASGEDLDSRLARDMIRALAAAAGRAGPDAGEIRRGLLEQELSDGSAGTFRFDDQGNRRGAIPIGVLQGGAWVAAAGPGDLPGRPTGDRTRQSRSLSRGE